MSSAPTDRSATSAAGDQHLRHVSQFRALARLPLVDATAISFAAPLITVAFAAFFLGERVRIYRWSAVAVGFAGIIVMLWPYLNLAQYPQAARQPWPPPSASHVR